ncbi:helix-turn-helix domain-containing protein [Flavilitoribacter nigricans]|uniref:HTH araC/xylS-type domain-containing protein n=1 Tax=Flavilitoribacter nigricans (strain ATCC 23147 / DSM 23189 / NBRC 102662 / NCIMB 1420 / SS-2) TaxID=1122177 RepID=A0A2D0NCJ9_FLAN2|nr:AraC family transcriptional regulator [Flavilitoribacter nigricans]PHN06215.1 hypothetical protein CRP01_11575 [Flavilitoribacter nigricans DSM 23189 = NBRC 102662]
MITYAEFWTFSICLLGAVQCFLLSSYFLVLKKGNYRAHRIFAVLMLLIGLRLLKSGHYLFIGEEMPRWWMNVGFAAHLAVGPTVLLYLKTYFGHKIRPKRYLLELFPAGLLLLSAPWLDTANFWYVGGYSLLLCYTLIYQALSIRLWWLEKAKEPGKVSSRWISSILFGTGIFFLAYFANYILRVIPYEAAPVLYSMAVLPISLYAWRSYPELVRSPGRDPARYENLNLDDQQMADIRDRILKLLENETLYLDPDLDLGKLAASASVPSHLLSMTFNRYMGTNFPRLINGYRVQEACRLLHDPDKAHYTIAAIAFEAGFNSLSVFNQHFKKETGVTPSVYRKDR